MSDPLVLTVCFGAVQFLGLLSVLWARMSKGTRHDLGAQTLFYGLLLVVGVTTLICSLEGHAWWPLSAVTFGAMVVGATVHTQSAEEEWF